MEDVLASLDNQSLVTVEASYGIALLEGHHHHHEDEEEAEHEHEDEHEHEEGGGYDPHVWLSPLNAKREMENIKNAMAEADPANAEYYEANYAAWSARCDQLDQAFKDGLSNLAIQDMWCPTKPSAICAMPTGSTRWGSREFRLTLSRTPPGWRRSRTL